MFLVDVVRDNKEELICDFAETYHIYDFKSLRPSTLATLAVGLRENSRTKMKLAGIKTDMDTLLLASISDRLGLLLYRGSKDAQKGVNKPASIVTELNKEHKKEVVGYTSGAEFLKERERLLNG